MNEAHENKYEGKAVIYVLKLQDDCWYIGRSKKLSQRLKNHQIGTSNLTWITKHTMISIDKIFAFENNEQIDGFVEDDITLRYMKQYGIDNERGCNFQSHLLQ